METATISYRVADFLKKYPPFYSMSDADLLALAARGRVRFHEPNDYILWQGEPHRFQVFVIQQGTVSVWNESAAVAELRDVRGPGDMLGLERFNGAAASLYSVRSESDVVIYAFPAEDFEALLATYPHARDYVSAEARITLDYRVIGDRRDVSDLFLHQLVVHKPVPRCDLHDTIGNAARQMLSSGADALAVVDAEHRARGVLTATTFLEWIAAGGTAADHALTVEHLLTEAPLIIGPTASVTDGVLAMSSADAPAIAITADGTAAGRLSAVVTTRDLGTVFGEQPSTLLHEIRVAAGLPALRDLNHRVRAFALHHLTSAASVDWIARFTHLADVGTVRRLVVLAGGDTLPACWCFCGSSGRAESLTRLAPHVMLIVQDASRLDLALETYERVIASLTECDYLPRLNLPFARPFYAATLDEWKDRYRGWLGDPVRQEMYRARTMFDLRAVYGDQSLWQQIDRTIVASVDQNFLNVIANDCLATLPPLTFFQDAVVDKSGEQTDVFHLEESALRPLVDVGRVFALAARAAPGHSTIERFATARTLLPEQQALFREAADTFRVVLWQQGRIGITQGTSGVDLPPSLLSRQDRHVLKSAFRSILNLLQFTGNLSWITEL